MIVELIKKADITVYCIWYALVFVLVSAQTIKREA